MTIEITAITLRALPLNLSGSGTETNDLSVIIIEMKKSNILKNNHAMPRSSFTIVSTS